MHRSMKLYLQTYVLLISNVLPTKYKNITKVFSWRVGWNMIRILIYVWRNSSNLQWIDEKNPLNDWYKGPHIKFLCDLEVDCNHHQRCYLLWSQNLHSELWYSNCRELNDQDFSLAIQLVQNNADFFFNSIFKTSEFPYAKRYKFWFKI